MLWGPSSLPGPLPAAPVRLTRSAAAEMRVDVGTVIPASHDNQGRSCIKYHLQAVLPQPEPVPALQRRGIFIFIRNKRLGVASLSRDSIGLYSSEFQIDSLANICLASFTFATWPPVFLLIFVPRLLPSTHCVRQMKNCFPLSVALLSSCAWFSQALVPCRSGMFSEASRKAWGTTVITWPCQGI